MPPTRCDLDSWGYWSILAIRRHDIRLSPWVIRSCRSSQRTGKAEELGKKLGRMSGTIETKSESSGPGILAALTTYPSRVSIGYYLAFIGLGLASAVFGPTLPSLAERTHTRLDEFSIIFAARAIGYLSGALGGGRVLDRVPGHPLIVMMLVAIAGLLVFVPLIPTLWVLAILMIFLGLAESIVDVGGNSLLIWLHREKVSPWMSGLHLFFGLGAFISPILIAQVMLATGDIIWAFWLIALLFIPSILWLPRLASPTLQHSVHAHKNQAPGLRLVLPVMLFVFLYVGAEVAFGAWVYTYATTLKLSAPADAAYLTSAFWGALTVGRLLAIPIAVQWKPLTMLVADLLVCLGGIGLIILMPGSTALLWIGTLAAGLGMASVYPSMMSLAERRMRVSGQVTGWISLGAGGGGMFLPWTIGQFFERAGAPATMMIIFSDLILAMIVLLALVSRPTQEV
jgi:MFS transporter, FHS family, Na+ dependent glucose transporter 1